MRTDTCANCGQTIYLVKKGPDLFTWVADPENPNRSSRCAGDGTNEPPPERKHAPVSAREAHR